MKKKALTLVLFFLLMISCKVEPKEINYGNDHCLYCDMTVVDKKHASQYVTQKGRAYMFDAVECLVMKINQEKNEDLLAFILVADFENPGNLVTAKTVTFLVSEKIKSPMGANLSAFKLKKTATKIQQEYGGELYTWSQIKAKLAQ
ncbi:MAG: nitrous oxide reductase accessory protein NosL [Flavobacteriaceae bacterium]|nr:nitrous oxide reductase accessory protein NosL [Flavobacteriaceae bacterium]